MFRIIVVMGLLVSVLLTPDGFSNSISKSVVRTTSNFQSATYSMGHLEGQPNGILVAGGPGSGHCC